MYISLLCSNKVINLSKRGQDSRLAMSKSPSRAVNALFVHEAEHLIRGSSTQTRYVAIDEEEQGNHWDQVGENHVNRRPPPPHHGGDKRREDDEGRVDERRGGAMSDFKDPASFAILVHAHTN